MNIFVTGGLGVIGSFFCRRALELGHGVTVLDACEEPRNEWLAGQLESLGARIRRERMETADLSEVLDHNLVLHAAAFTGIPSSADRPDDDWVSNVDATRHLLNALRGSASPPVTVVLSSVKPYKIDHVPVVSETVGSAERWAWRPDVAVDENWPLDPDEPYAASKMAQSAICLAYARTYGLPLTVFRCSNLYGPGPCHGPRHGWLTWFCISAAIGRPIVVQGDGMQSRDMLHAADVADAVVAAYAHIDKVSGKLFNLGGGSPNVISVGEAAAALQAFGAKVESGPGRRFEDRVFVTDHSRFTHLTGWRPGVGVRDGLDSVYRWAVDNCESLSRLYEGL